MSSTAYTSPADSSSHIPLDNSGTSTPWEPPHPGNRLSLALEAGLGLMGRAADGGCADDVAAKGQKLPKHLRPWLGRRANTTSMDTQPSPSETDRSRTSSIISVMERKDSATTTASICSGAAANVTTAQSSGTLVETVDCKQRASSVPSVPSDCSAFLSQGCLLSDLSNFISSSAAPFDRSVDTTAEISQTHCTVAPDDDVYGWDAELSRQLELGRTPTIPTDQPCDCNVDYAYRRTTGAKRSLLNRVFSLGNAPRSVSVEVRRTPSSSS